MTTVQITLTVADHGDQDWGDALAAIQHCTPINQNLLLRDGLSGAIDTHSGGFRVQVDAFDEFAQAERLTRALFAEWGMDPAHFEVRFAQALEAVLTGITQGSRLDEKPGS